MADVEVQKRIKALRKKLVQIEKLKTKGGLTKEELEKLNSETDIVSQIQALESGVPLEVVKPSSPASQKAACAEEHLESPPKDAPEPVQLVEPVQPVEPACVEQAAEAAEVQEEIDPFEAEKRIKTFKKKLIQIRALKERGGTFTREEAEKIASETSFNDQLLSLQIGLLEPEEKKTARGLKRKMDQIQKLKEKGQLNSQEREKVSKADSLKSELDELLAVRPVFVDPSRDEKIALHKAAEQAALAKKQEQAEGPRQAQLQAAKQQPQQAHWSPPDETDFTDMIGALSGDEKAPGDAEDTMDVEEGFVTKTSRLTKHKAKAATREAAKEVEAARAAAAQAEAEAKKRSEKERRAAFEQAQRAIVEERRPEVAARAAEEAARFAERVRAEAEKRRREITEAKEKERLLRETVENEYVMVLPEAEAAAEAEAEAAAAAEVARIEAETAKAESARIEAARIEAARVEDARVEAAKAEAAAAEKALSEKKLQEEIAESERLRQQQEDRRKKTTIAARTLAGTGRANGKVPWHEVEDDIEEIEELEAWQQSIISSSANAGVHKEQRVENVLEPVRPVAQDEPKVVEEKPVESFQAESGGNNKGNGETDDTGPVSVEKRAKNIRKKLGQIEKLKAKGGTFSADELAKIHSAGLLMQELEAIESGKPWPPIEETKCEPAKPPTPEPAPVESVPEKVPEPVEEKPEPVEEKPEPIVEEQQPLVLSPDDVQKKMKALNKKIAQIERLKLKGGSYTPDELQKLNSEPMLRKEIKALENSC